MEPSVFRELHRRLGYPDVPPPAADDWQSLDAAYAPVEFTAPTVRAAVADWRDPDLARVWRRVAELSMCRRVLSDRVTGRPLNPAGPTGVSGLGRLYSLGPNPTADGAVTCGRGAGTRLLLVRRRDTGQLALPGGFAESMPGGRLERPLRTALREVREETGLDVRRSAARVLHRGVAVGALRNTDNAWIENTAFHLRLPEAARHSAQPTAGDDAREAGWYPLFEVPLPQMSDTHAANVRRLRRTVRREERAGGCR